MEATRRGPADGTTHWSSYRLAKKLGISQSSVSRVGRHFGIQPYRSRGYMASDDPEFEEKAADIIGCIEPPLNAGSSVSMKRALSKLWTAWTRVAALPRESGKNLSIILAFGRNAFSKSDSGAWIRVTVEPSTVVGLRRPRLVGHRINPDDMCSDWWH